MSDDARTKMRGASAEKISEATRVERPTARKRATLPEIGDVVAGRYKIESLLGVGGMAQVFAVVDEAHGHVALKILAPNLQTNPQAVERFAREVRAMAALRSPYIVRIFDHGVYEDDLPFFVMERLVGKDLADVVTERGPLPFAEACIYIEQACEALEEAHAAGIIHRDIKPRNLFLATTTSQTAATGAGTGTPTLRVLDFGIARALDGSVLRDATLTEAGKTIGTIPYMAPEQVVDSTSVDPRSDLWALGACFYRILTNQVPFQRKTEARLIDAIMQDAPQAITRHRPDVPPTIEAIIMRCLTKNPDGRFATAAEMRAAVRQARLALPLPAPKAEQQVVTVIVRNPADPSSPSSAQQQHQDHTAILQAAPASSTSNPIVVIPAPTQSMMGGGGIEGRFKEPGTKSFGFGGPRVFGTSLVLIGIIALFFAVCLGVFVAALHFSR